MGLILGFKVVYKAFRIKRRPVPTNTLNLKRPLVERIIMTSGLF